MENIQDLSVEDIISKLDPEFTVESIKKQIDAGISRTAKTNYLGQFRENFKSIAKEYEGPESIKFIRNDTYEKVVELIADKYDLEVDLESTTLPFWAAFAIYEFFVLDIHSVYSYFFESYILENSKSLADRLPTINNNISVNSIKQVVSAADDNIIKIMSSMHNAIDIIANMDLEFTEFLEYIKRHDEAGSLLERFDSVLDKFIGLPEDMYTQFMQPIINEDEGCSVVINMISNSLYKRFIDDETEEE